MRFYSESLRRAAEALETDPDRGLTAQEAARRLAQYGENQLRQAVLTEQLRSICLR